jgi:hypothetical protein
MKPIEALLAATLVLGPVAQALAGAIAIHVRKTNGCGCCLAWMEHLEENGFAPTGENVFAALLVRYKLDDGVPQLVVSCHTAEVEGCIIEGHVPAADIRRLLEERPDAVGLAVPDRTCGSPRMGPESEREAYDLLLIRRDGSTEVFTGYEAA